MLVGSHFNDQRDVERNRNIHAVLQAVSNKVQEQRTLDVHATWHRLDLPFTTTPNDYISEQNHHLNNRQRDETESLLDDPRKHLSFTSSSIPHGEATLHADVERLVTAVERGLHGGARKNVLPVENVPQQLVFPAR